MAHDRNSTSAAGNKKYRNKPSPTSYPNTASLLLVLLAMRQDSAHHNASALAHSQHATTRRQTPRIDKIISRKSDGKYIVYTPSDTNSGSGGGENDAAGPAGERDELFEASKKYSIRRPSVPNRFRHALRSTFLPSLPRPPTGNTNDEDGNCSHQIMDTLRGTNFLRYILYDNIQDLSTSLRSVLATQRVLHGVGVGRSGATALSATINFLIRDGCGMAASLLFTSHVSHSFRRNVKKWKYFADIMIDFGITLEILAPSVLTIPVIQGWFLPLLCLGNVCKALCGVAAGACGGALQMYWAVKIIGTEDGISEIAAKSGAQRTLVGGIGLVLSAFLAKWLGNGNHSTAFGLYCLLTAIHLFSNYKALKLVALDWMNGGRLALVVDEFVKCIAKNDEKVDEKVANGSLMVSGPDEISRREPLLFLPEFLSTKQKMQTAHSIRMGVSFNELCRLSHLPQSTLQAHVAKVQNQYADRYILSVGHGEKQYQNEICILISFFSNCSNVERAKAYMHGCLVLRTLVSLEANGKEEHHLISDGEVFQKAETIARNELVRLWPIFERCVANAGWKLDKTECSTEGYEIYLE